MSAIILIPGRPCAVLLALGGRLVFGTRGRGGQSDQPAPSHRGCHGGPVPAAWESVQDECLTLMGFMSAVRLATYVHGSGHSDGGVCAVSVTPTIQL